MIISVDDIVSMPDFIGQDTKILLGIRLQYGTNYVTFKGNGTVKIEYQGGAL